MGVIIWGLSSVYPTVRTGLPKHYPSGDSLAPLTFACVAENRPEWADRVHSLVLSIRTFGGSLKDAPVVVGVVDDVADRFAAPLRELGAEVVVVPRVDPRYPYANKLNMLDLAVDETLLALDCDVVVLGDIEREAHDGLPAAKPADADFLAPADWRTIFDAFSLERPPRDTVTTTFGQRTYPYFNSGVLLLPAHVRPPLRRSWERFVFELPTLLARDRRLARHRFYTDQIALTCALTAERINVRPLPVRMNFPTHLRVHGQHEAEAVPPLIVHYHKRIDERGFLLPTVYPEANDLLDRFNRARASALGIGYGGIGEISALDRVKQRLRSHPRFHAPPVRFLRRAVRRVVPGPGR